MAIQIINVGNAVNDGSGDDLRTAFIKVNENFDELNDKQAENNTASNVGSGIGVFKEKLGVDLKFKSFIAGDHITITPSTSQITIANTLTAGTGVTITSSQINIGQAVSTTSNVTFNNVTTSNNLTVNGTSTFNSSITATNILTVSGVSTFNNNVIVTGNLTVNGTTTTINSNTLDVVDKNITLAKTNTPTNSSANGAGITIKGTDDKTLTYVEADDKFVFNKRLDADSFHGNLFGNVTGNITGNLTGNVTGAVTGDLTGNVTGEVTGNLTGLVNNINVTNIYDLLYNFDFGGVNNQVTNVIELLLQSNTFDFGSITSPASFDLDNGSLV